MTTPFSNIDDKEEDTIASADSKFQHDENETYMNFMARLAFESRRKNESPSAVRTQGKNETD